MAEKNMAFKRILVPIDLSDSSVIAAQYAISIARSMKATITLLHVVDTSTEAAGFYLPHLSYEKLGKEMATEGDQMLKKFAQTHFKGARNLSVKLSVGEPYKEIIKAAKSADLVIMSTTSRGNVDRFFFGSTTERVIRRAACPVLAIPPKG